MTVSNNNRRDTYSGDDSTTSFATTFSIMATTNTLVELTNAAGTITTQTKDVDYTIAEPAAFPSLATVVMTTAPASGETLTLSRSMPFTQTTDFVEKGPLPASAIEGAMDELTMMSLQNQETIARVLQVPTSVDTDTVSLAIPTPVADGVLKWDDTATALEYTTLTTSSGILNVVDDTTPQAGGDFDMNGFNLGIDDNRGIEDNNGDELLWFQNQAGSAVNYLEITNTDTTAGPILAAAGDDTNIDLELKSKATGSVNVTAQSLDLGYGSTGPGELRFLEDTDNGAHYWGLAAPSALTASTTLTLPDGDGAADQVLQTDGAGTLSWSAKGKVAQTPVYTVTGAVATGTTTIPIDDTIPQITEGTEFMTRTKTPTSATNLLKIEIVAMVAVTAAGHHTGALFQDSTASALASTSNYEAAGNTLMRLKITHWMVAGTTNEITFRFRAGSSAAGTMTFNGFSGARKHGGIMNSSMSVTEYEV